MPRKPRLRALRRQTDRAEAKLAESRERLFERDPGGTAERPTEVVSAAVIEAQAEAITCPRCGGRQSIEEHVALTVSGDRLRQVRLQCRSCGSRRSLWFRIRQPQPN